MVEGFDVFGEIGSPSWFELNASDFDAADRFYAHAFDWSIVRGDDEPRYAAFERGGRVLAGVLDASRMLRADECRHGTWHSGSPTSTKPWIGPSPPERHSCSRRGTCRRVAAQGCSTRRARSSSWHPSRKPARGRAACPAARTIERTETGPASAGAQSVERHVDDPLALLGSGERDARDTGDQAHGVVDADVGAHQAG